ncbi:ankyrin repeat family protein [Wolffia australiana]
MAGLLPARWSARWSARSGFLAEIPRENATTRFRTGCDASCSSFSFFRYTPSPSLLVRGINSSSNVAEAFWEEPDDGYGSSLDVMNDEEDDGRDYESSGEGRASGVHDALSFASDVERVRHEAYLLLDPEERKILDQNEGPNISKISSSKWRPYHTRALSGQIPFLGALVQNGVDIDANDKDGLTPLHLAVIGKKEAVISHLLRRGANPHLADRDGATPLHYAVQVGAIQTVKLLIKYKVDVNTADHEGWTPLHLAIQGRSRDIAKVLLINGADKNRRNKEGKTPLDLSLCYGKDFKSYELAKLLKLLPANREL